MSGHSHWAGIKHKKALIDAKRGKEWSKVAKSIIIAAKQGGGNPDDNIRLRAAIAEARAVNMPKDNITRAIKRGTGELDPVEYEEVLYEGYGPGCVSWNFDKKGVIEVESGAKGEEEMMDLAIEAGADDVESVEDAYKITCAPEAFDSVLEYLNGVNIQPIHAEITYVPRDAMVIDDLSVAQKALKLTDALDEHEDIQNVSANFVIAESILAQLEE